MYTCVTKHRYTMHYPNLCWQQTLSH